ncbi:MAG TPA: DUF2752 domain-containing protein [Candidatus Angelobacter sp.]|nr:DUF2752 domain-containing protein [Candidatus Angelobacter sp.]
MKRKVIAGAAGAAFLAGLAVVYNFSPSLYSFYPRCPFYTATHWLCPGCGSTRALYALLHGNWRSALHYNAMFTLLAPFVLAWIGYCWYRVMRYDRLPRLAFPRGAAIGMGVAVLLFTIARNTIFVF